jgi:hypothetical protein
MPPLEPLVLIGYFPKKVVQRMEWLKAGGVKAIRSVSECMAKGPPNWMEHWTHNEMWVYDTIAAAWAVVPAEERDEYEMQAYRMLPVKWNEGKRVEVELPELCVEPLPEDFENVGFDAVSLEEGFAGFGHSPLSCNGMAEEIATNEHCLLDDVEMAARVAGRFSRGNAEPGPYYVVEVLRQVGR